MRVRLNDGKEPFAFNINDYIRDLPSWRIHTTKITAVTISQDGNFIASFSSLDNIIALWRCPPRSDAPVILGAQDLVSSSKIYTDNKLDLCLAISTKPLPYLYESGLFLVLSCIHRSPIVLYQDMKRVFPDCLKGHDGVALKGRAEFLPDGKTLIIQSSAVIYVMSVTSWPWTLVRKIIIIDQTKVSFAFNPTTLKSYIVLCWRKRDFFDMIDPHTFQSHSYFIDKSWSGRKVCISSAGDLHALPSGYIVERKSGLSIAEHHESAEDHQFVHEDRHILKIHFDGLFTKATLSDARSGTKLASVTLPEQELSLLKHIKLVDDRVVAVIPRTDLSCRNVLIVEQWNWEDSFRVRSEKYPIHGDHEIQWHEHMDNSYSLSNSFVEKESEGDRKLKVFESDGFYQMKWFGGKSGSSTLICGANTKAYSIHDRYAITAMPRGFSVFWESNDEIECITWMLPPSLSKIRKFSYQYINDCSKRTDKNAEEIDVQVLRLDVTCIDGEKLYTLLPLVEFMDRLCIPAEWMQSSCRYLNKTRSDLVISLILLSSIKKYVCCSVFNHTTAIHDLIRLDNDKANGIVEEILKRDHYVPTVLRRGENPLKTAIEISSPSNSSLIRKFLEYCLRRCVHQEEPGFMSVVVDALPHLAAHYPSLLSPLLKQCSFIKVPSGYRQERDISNRARLWAHKFDGSIESKLQLFDRIFESLFDRLQRLPRHTATFCYVPLPDLCTYPNPTSNKHFIFPPLSPFAKLVMFNSFADLQSPPFEAVIKFKWHAFARRRFFFMLFLYILHAGLFMTAISVTTVGYTALGKKLMVVSMILGGYLTLSWIRRAIMYFRRAIKTIRIIKTRLIERSIENFEEVESFAAEEDLEDSVHVSRVPFFSAFSTYIELAAFVLPTVTWFLERNNTKTPEIRSLSILFSWLFIGSQLAAFKSFAIFIAVLGHIIRKMRWLLFFLVFVLFAFAHSFTILLWDTPPKKGSNTFKNFDKSLKNVWSMLLSDYSSLEPWPENRLMDILVIAFSFATTIVILNIIIALMTNIYENSIVHGHTTWVRKRAQLIVDMELLWLTPEDRQNRNYFPRNIIYEAFTEEFEEWPKKLEENKIPIPWKDNVPVKENLQNLEPEHIRMVISYLTAELQKFDTKESNSKSS